MSYSTEEVFRTVEGVNGAAFSGIGCQVYFSSFSGPAAGSSNLYTWSLTSPENDPELVGVIVNNGVRIGRADGLAFSEGNLYLSAQSQTSSSAPAGLYLVDPSLNAELVIPYSDEIVGGIASDSSSGIIYGLDDNNFEIVQFDLDDMSIMTVASYPTVGGSVVVDIDGLAAGDGKLYLITDEPGNFYVYDLAQQQYVETIESPFTNGETFSGAAYVTGSGLGEN